MYSLHPWYISFLVAQGFKWLQAWSTVKYVWVDEWVGMNVAAIN